MGIVNAVLIQLESFCSRNIPVEVVSCLGHSIFVVGPNSGPCKFYFLCSASMALVNLASVCLNRFYKQIYLLRLIKSFFRRPILFIGPVSGPCKSYFVCSPTSGFVNLASVQLYPFLLFMIRLTC